MLFRKFMSQRHFNSIVCGASILSKKKLNTCPYFEAWSRRSVSLALPFARFSFSIKNFRISSCPQIAENCRGVLGGKKIIFCSITRCQFHQRSTSSFFVQKSFEQLFCTYILGLYFFGTRKLAQKLLVKCWWNYPLVEMRDIEDQTEIMMQVRNLVIDILQYARFQNKSK